eukprot:1291685-Pyramimonas_sp.AAC.1
MDEEMRCIFAVRTRLKADRLASVPAEFEDWGDTCMASERQQKQGVATTFKFVGHRPVGINEDQETEFNQL